MVILELSEKEQNNFIYGFDKPIMIAGGIGNIYHQNRFKNKFEKVIY